MRGGRSTGKSTEIDFWIFCHACNCAFRPEFFGAVFWIDGRGFEVDVEVEVEAAPVSCPQCGHQDIPANPDPSNPDPDPGRPFPGDSDFIPSSPDGMFCFLSCLTEVRSWL